MVCEDLLPCSKSEIYLLLFLGLQVSVMCLFLNNFCANLGCCAGHMNSKDDSLDALFFFLNLSVPMVIAGHVGRRMCVYVCV